MVPEPNVTSSSVSQTTTALRRIARSCGHVLIIVPRLFAVVVSLAIWVCILPLWAFMLTRSCIVFSILNVLSCFSGDGPADPQRLDRIARLWPHGVVVICGILSGHPEPRQVSVDDQVRLIFTETVALALVMGTIVIGQLALSFANERLPALAADMQRAITQGHARPPAWPRY